MLWRKIYQDIEEFYENNPGKALMVTGARQVGKSFIIEEYARNHFSHVVVVDFIEHPEYVELLDGAAGAEEVTLRLSAVFGDEMVPGSTMIFFDEVQECRELITQIKYLVQEGSYRYILSGSLLGTVFSDILSVPVGYLSVIRMFPLDFQEFAAANGVDGKVIDAIQDAYNSRTALDPFIHSRMMSLFELYLMVGGMPEAVSAYIRTKNLRAVSDSQRAILELYKADISKYDKDHKLYLNEIFDLIPSELNSKNKRFILKNMNENAKFSRYENSFIWLKNAGAALPVHLAAEPKYPLLLSEASNLFKLFLNDVGLLAAQYGDGVQIKILKHETSINFGAIYENAAAEEMIAHGHTLYYYNSKKFGEVDFLTESDGQVIPVEIKSGKNYYRHNAMDNLLEQKEYGLKEGYVFCGGNVERAGKITYFPIYMIMFLKKKELPADMIYESDFTDLNDMISAE